MAALATVEDVSALIGAIPDDTDVQVQIARLLELASAKVRRFTRQQISAVEDDELTVYGAWSSELYLGQKPVTAITSITVDDVLVDPSEYTWTVSGLVERIYCRIWGTPRQVIVVTYDHGYVDIPDEIVGIVAELVAAKYSSPEALDSETIGNYAYTGGDGAGSAFKLSEDQEEILKDFKTRVTSMDVLPSPADLLFS